MAAFLFRVPDEISFAEAATIEPLATSLHGANLASPADGETLVIMGAGIIGLGVLQAVRALCSAKTFVVDLSEMRLSLASDLGADVTINASREDAVKRIMEMTGSEELSLVDGVVGSIDTVFDCAGGVRETPGD